MIYWEKNETAVKKAKHEKQIIRPIPIRIFRQAKVVLYRTRLPRNIEATA